VTATAQDPGCVFCQARDGGAGPDLIVHRGVLCFVILNLYPYNNGHVMIVPNRHVATLAQTSVEERQELMELTRRSEMALTELYQPHGLNIGINLGRPAGAGIVDHVHIHVVPRWNGDTNFMSVVGNVRVVPEDLDQTARKLRPIYARLAGGS